MRKYFVIVALMLVLLPLFSIEAIRLGNGQNQLRLIDNGSGSLELEYTLGSFLREEVIIDGEEWYLPSIESGGLLLEAGLPELPAQAGSVIISPTAKIEMSLVDSEYVELPMKIAPSKGNLTRDIDPATVPYEFSSFYDGSGFYPSSPVELSEPFIMRDFRGVTVRFMPFVYYPERGVTRVYTTLRVALNENGSDEKNILPITRAGYHPAFREMYQGFFLNFSDAKYPSLNEDGDILVINHSMFTDTIQPWVDWKRQLGFNVEVVDIQVAGPSATQLKSFIQDKYDNNPNLLYIQIMGDAPQVPSLSANGGGSDPSFALLAGNDNYPDAYVGRFSAQTTTEMQTQISKVLYYERDMPSGSQWVQKAMGIASNEGGGYQGDNGESDQQHMEIIRNNLLAYGYTEVDQMYQNYGATATQVGNNINTGRGYVNYVGHGSDTSWVTTGFNTTNVGNLTNHEKYPFIYSVACVNGNFVSRTCFAEAWLRAYNNGGPTGAVAMYASSVNQSWNPPMRAQDEAVELVTTESKKSIGGICYNSSSKMIEVYGSNGVNEYKNWHIFGDASMIFRSKDPAQAMANYNNIMVLGMENFEVMTEPGATVTLFANGILYGKAIADNSGLAIVHLDVVPLEPMDLTLTIFAYNKATIIDQIQVLPSDGAYIIVQGVQVEDGNNGIPEFDETITLHVNMENVGNEDAEGVNISIDTFDPYITILGSETLEDPIEANSVAQTSEGIAIQISNFVPDQHLAEYTIVITLASGESFSYDKTLLISSPEIEWGPVSIDDSEGNSNGTLDPGETVIINVPIVNNGHSPSPEASVSISLTGANHLITPINDVVAALAVGEMGVATFEVTLSASATHGSTLQLTSTAIYGGLTAFRRQNIIVGVLYEGFENGLENFDWQFSNGNWSIVSPGHDSGYAIKSAAINHNQNTSMSVTLNSAASGFISFWKKVSSENNGDYFKFYINGQLKNRWSGEEGEYTQVSYMVSAGTNTYTWEYSKDYAVTAGDDCVYIDNIMFPVDSIPEGMPEAQVDTTALDFGTVEVGDYVNLPLSIQNIGDAVMLVNARVSNPYSLSINGGERARQVSFAIQPQNVLEMEVTFMPGSNGNYPGTLTLATDDPDAPTIIVSLTGECAPVSNEDIVEVVATQLVGNHPNPFNPETTIRFSLKEKANVKIDIYNVLGQKVRTLVNGELFAGNHNAVWNGKDDGGHKVASGIYFYKMQSSNGYQKTMKMVLMK